MNATAGLLPPPSSGRGFGASMVMGAGALALTFLGLVELYSAAQGTAHGSLYYFERQVVWLALALAVGAFATRVNLDQVRAHTWMIVGLAVVLLVVVRVPHIGVKTNGSWRWLDLGPMRAQPSDFAKLALVFGLAHYLALYQREVRAPWSGFLRPMAPVRWGAMGAELRTLWRGFVLPMGLAGLFAGLIMIEPDFGTATLCALVGCLLLFLAGVRLLYLFPSMLGSAGLLVLAVLHNANRLKRFIVFFDLAANKKDGTYQLWQAVVGFGSGGATGVGLGEGRQQRFFLPEAHTDFVLAVIGEELGLIATAGIVLLFLIIFITAFRALRRAPTLYEFTLAAGLLLMLTGQALINLGVVTGLLPTKGMSLPFLSYGGSNLLLMYALAGLLINLFRRWERPALAAARAL